MNTKTQKRRFLFQLLGGTCWFCKRQCIGLEVPSGASDPLLFTIEHIVPKRWGGDNGFSNMVGACFACNWSRACRAEGHVRSCTHKQTTAFRIEERREINRQRGAVKC